LLDEASQRTDYADYAADARRKPTERRREGTICQDHRINVDSRSTVP
jgi:hypothetical protein